MVTLWRKEAKITRLLKIINEHKIMPKTKKGSKKRVIFRSSKTGRFVTKKYATKRKSTTERETI